MLKLSPALVALSMVVAFGANSFALEADMKTGKSAKETRETEKAIKGEESLKSDTHSKATGNVVRGSFGLIPTELKSSKLLDIDGENKDIQPVIESLVKKDAKVIGFFSAVLGGLKGKTINKLSKSSVRQLALFLDAANPVEVAKYNTPANVKAMVDLINTYDGTAENNFNGGLHFAAKALKSNPNLSIIDALAQGMEDFLVTVDGFSRSEAKKTADDLVRKGKCLGQAA